jgi:hypothetical protein
MLPAQSRYGVNEGWRCLEKATVLSSYLDTPIGLSGETSAGSDQESHEKRRVTVLT